MRALISAHAFTAPGALTALRVDVDNVVHRAATWPWWVWAAAIAVCSGLFAVWWFWFHGSVVEESEDELDLETGSEVDGEAKRSVRESQEAGRVKDRQFKRASTKEKMNYGLLDTNFKAEEVVEAKTHMFQYSLVGMNNKHTKMLYYDADRTTGWSALFHLQHTCIYDMHLWRTCSVYLVLALVLAVTSYTVRTLHKGNLDWDASSTVDYLASASMYLSALLGFMLGLFVSEIISRWWRCRMDCVDVLWSAISDISLLLSIRCPGPEDAPFKENVLRLGLVCHRLVYAEARGMESRENLLQLVHVGLLTDEEVDCLDGQPAKSQLVLVWIGRLYTQLGNKRGWMPEYFATLNEQLRKGRSAIGKVYAYCNTQLPYQYVHLLSFCVLLCNLLLATKCGISIGQSLSAGGGPSYVRALLQVFQVVVEPFAYHAFMRLCCELSNPFGHDFSDFPGFAYHCQIRQEGFSLHKAGEKAPAELMKLTA